MTKPRQVAPKYERNIPYTSLSLTFPARDAVRRAAATLSGKVGRRVGISEAIIALVAATDWNAAARKLEARK